ncbi:MAG: TVP38/TMEM64 family protein [Clostridiales bacterium]|jgi:uncharacterized membrane protein YdjX (TVP38/TMEM64 family)|nr:TVP38/TMEM64 family protein [Clostridiales bacterium]
MEKRTAKGLSKAAKARIALIAVLVLAIICYFAIPAFNSKVNGIIMIFSSMSVDNVIGFIRSYGVYAVVISFLLMVFQSVAAPLPAFLITFANAAIWGWWKGAILSWSSAMVGAIVCFYIARILGREAVEKLTTKTAVSSVDKFFERYGKSTILICRLLPFVSFDFVSYAAGLTSMSLASFLIATGVGQLPATIVYSYVGGMLTGSVKTVVTGLFIAFALFALTFMLKNIYNDRHKEDKAVEEVVNND